MSAKQILQPRPLFDTLENFEEMPLCLKNYLSTLSINNLEKEYQYAIEFLKSYAGSPDTFNAYRREVERILQWAWLVIKKPLRQLNRNDIRDYIHFIQSPIKSWVGTKTVSRFKDDENGLRAFNPEWRPFVVRLAKSQFKAGIVASRMDYQMSNKSVQAVFAGLSTFFTYLMQETYLDSNPVLLVRQKKQYIQTQQNFRVTRKLSHKQWLYVINTVEALANENPEYERSLFIMSSFYLLGLRISELSETPGRIPAMGHFAPDKNGLWWFTTIGKGNKIREIACPNEMMKCLKRYREYCGLSSLPTRGEQTPLVSKQRGRGGLGTRQIRNIVQACFDKAVYRLQQDGEHDQAQDLMTATVHWLRHTAISSDVEFRPREHIRDDVGHENANIMDKYIDTDRKARHESAQKKKLRPSGE